MIKKLAKSIREYKKDTILTPVFISGEVFMEILIPFLLGKLIDDGIIASNLKVILILGVVLIVAALFSLFFGITAGKYASKASSGFAKNLRQDMYEKVQKFSFYNIDKFSTSSIVTRLTTDVSNVQNAFMSIIRGAVRSPLMIIFSFTMAFITNRKIALIFLAVAPILGFLLIFIAKKAHPIFKRVFNTYDDLNNVVQENVKGVRVVKSFVQEDYEIEKFEKISNSIYKDFSKAEAILAFNSPLMQFTIYLIITLISWFGAKFIVSRKYDNRRNYKFNNLCNVNIKFTNDAFYDICYNNNISRIC